MRTFCDAERESIMLRIRERCSTSVSERAECGGRLNDFVTVYPYPYPENMPKAEFSWKTADEISRRGGMFRFS